MYINNKLVIAKNNDFICLNPNMLNRHGIITGATGTGKTISLKVIAESLSSLGVPTIITDIKSDLSGCAKIGENNSNLDGRIKKLGLNNFEFKKFPVRFWDVFGEIGHPIRVTVSDMGPTLISKILDLSEAGKGILNIAFAVADKEGLELIDLKDLKSILKYVSKNSKELKLEYGNISEVSISTILRKLLEFKDGDLFFGEPNLNILDFMHVSEESGNGYINLIESNKLVKNPTLYATFLVWLLSSFYEQLPEVGDLDKPKCVLFLDEAHLIFSEMNDNIIKKLTQIIKLIRSKGIGVFFISQSPSDIPDEILNQLGNRICHSLRAYTPKELNSVKVAAKTFRKDSSFDLESAILSLGIGEAIVSFINEAGEPSICEKAFILPPQSYISNIDIKEIKKIVSNGVMEIKYRNIIDSDSAYEKIERINKQNEEKEKNELLKLENEKKKLKEEKEKEKALNKANKEITRNLRKVTNSAMSSIGRQIGNAIMRGILGTKK